MKLPRHRWLWSLAVGLALAEAGYFWGANALLRSGLIFEWVNPQPEKIALHYDTAWSPLPGLVFIEGFSIEGHDGEIVWRVEVPRIRTWISLTSFALRTLRTYGVTGEGGRVEIRRAASLPAEPQTEAQTEPQTESKRKRRPFAFDFHGIDLEAIERLSVFEYEYVGPLSVGGAFALQPGRRLRVGRGLIAFEGGRVLLAGRELSRALRGEIDASLGEWKPKEEGPERLFDLLSAEIRLAGALEDASFLRYYLRGISWLKLLGVSGDFSLEARIEDGAFAAPTKARIAATSMGAGLGESYVARGLGSVDWAVEEDEQGQRLSMKLELRDYQGYDRRLDRVIARGQRLTLNADSYDLGLRKIFSDLSDLSATVRTSKVEVTDLSFVNDFIPATSQLEVLSGTASLEARLDVSTRRSAPEGFVRVSGKKAQARFGGARLSADFNVDARLKDTQKGSSVFRVSGTRVSLSNVNVLRKDRRKLKDWKGKILLREGWLLTEGPILFKGDAELDFDDARPVLAVLAVNSRIARIIERAADLRDLRGRCSFALGPDRLELSDLELKSSDLDLLGRLRIEGKSQKILAFVDWRAFQIAFAIDDGRSRTKIVRARQWYHEQPAWPGLKAR